MKKVLLSFMMVLSTVIVANAITYTAKDTSLCKGGDMVYTISASEAITSTLSLSVGLQTFSGSATDNNGYTFELSALTTSGTYEAEVLDVDNENTVLATATITIVDAPESPVITSTAESFLVDENYIFNSNTTETGLEYKWSVNSDEGLYTFIDESSSSQNATIQFNDATTYGVWCQVTSTATGCSISNFMSVTVKGTYTAYETTFCSAAEENEFVVTAPEMVEETDYIIVFDDLNQSFTSDATDGQEIYFRFSQENLSSIESGVYSVTVLNPDSTEVLTTSQITIIESRIPTISNKDQTYYVGSTYTFTVENAASDATYKWEFFGPDSPTSNVSAGSDVEVSFPCVGDFSLKCTAVTEYCSDYPQSDTYTVTVENVSICTVNEVSYASLTNALAAAAESGSEVIMTSDVAMDSAIVSSSYSSVTINLNGKTLSMGSLEVGGSLTITGAGTLSTYINNANTNADYTLTIDASTVSVQGMQWMAKNIVLSNGANVILEGQAFLGGGDEDGFNLTIDGTSKLNINGQTITGYNPERIASQISPYVPSGYTVSYDESYVTFEPDADITLSNPLVTVSFPAESYTITAGDSVQVCLTITSDDENFNLDNVTVSFSYLEAEVEFISVEGEPTCTYIKAMPGGSWAQVMATVTYDNVEYYGTTEVNINAAPLALECPESNLEYEDGGTYQMKVNEWFESDYYNFVWTSSDENVATVDGSGLVTYVSSGTVTISCEATNKYDGEDVQTASCDLTIEKPITYTVDHTTFCEGDEDMSVTITASEATTYSVYTSDGYQYVSVEEGTELICPFNGLPVGTYTYSIVQDGETVDEFTVTVNSLPSVEISCPSDGDAVVGNTWTFTNGSAATGYSEGTTYEWTSDQISFTDASSQSQEITFETAGSAAVALTVTDANECSNTTTCTFTIEEGTTYSVPETTTVCSGEAAGITITASKEVTADDITIKRENGSEISSVDIEGTTITLGVGAGTYYLYESGKTDAVATFSVVEEDMYVELDGATEVTLPGTATYTASSLEGATYRWSCSDATIAQSESIMENAETVAITFPKTGSYTVKATATSKNGCAATEELEVNVSVDQTAISVYFDEAGYELTIGTDTTICLNVDGLSATDYTVSYSYGEEYMSLTEQESNTLCQTVSPLAAGSTMLEASVAYAGETFTASAVITVAEATQTYTVNGGEEVTWCHGAESGHVAFTVTSNMDIPESLTVNHEWASNIQVDVYGKEASIEFDYPYNGRQGFQLITIEGGDTTVVVENVNAFGKGHLKPSFPEDQDSVVIFGNGNTIELMADGNAGSTSGSWYTALGSQARFNWYYDDEVTKLCLADSINEGSDCNNARVRFTFPQTGTYSVGFSISDDGCYSDAIYKNIYVVDFDPALFSISPEKDTIEIGAPNGAQFTLNYDGEPYSNYTLKSDGDVTIDGTSVFDNEIVGTFEVYAEVSDLRVATAWVTVVEKPIEYTVANASVCEGTDEAVVVITASDDLTGVGLTVQDVDGNVYWPESEGTTATFSANYLEIGTHTFYVYEDDVQKAEFTVTVNEVPSISIECPSDPVVNGTWSPLSTKQENVAYSWASDQLANLNGYTSCCPVVTFEEEGDVTVKLTITDTLTGCSNEDSCVFTVGKAIEYTLNATEFTMEVGDNSLLKLYANGEEYSGTVEWATTDDAVATVSGGLVSALTAGKVGIYALANGTELASASVVVKEAFTCNEDIIDGSTYNELSYEELVVGDQLQFVFSGITNFTGRIGVCVEDVSAEDYTTSTIISEETSGESFYTFDVVEGEVFTINQLINIATETDYTKHIYKLCIRTFPSECPTGLDEYGSSLCYGKICPTSYSLAKVGSQATCDGTQIAFEYSEDGGNYTYLRENIISEPVVGDEYTVYWQGTADFTGTVNFALIDRSEEASWWTEVSNWDSYYVTAGEAFTISVTLKISDALKSSAPSVALFATIDDNVDATTLCETDFSLIKTNVEYTFAETDITMFVGQTKYVQLLADGVEYDGEVTWAVNNVTGSDTESYITVDKDGLVTAIAEGQAQVEAYANKTLLASTLVTVSTFDCDGTTYTKDISTEDVYITFDVTSELAEGETYRLTLEGTTDFDGFISIPGILDFSEEEINSYTSVDNGLHFAVTAGESFSYTTFLHVESLSTSEKPDYKLTFFPVSNNSEVDILQVCVSNYSLDKQEQTYTIGGPYDMAVGEQRQLYVISDNGTVPSDSVTWEATSNAGVVRLASYGYLDAVSEGSAIITASIDGEIVATTTVSVVESSSQGISIGFDEAGYTISKVGGELPICIQTTGLDAAEMTITIMDTTVVSYTNASYGSHCLNVTGLKVGVTTIYASAEYEGQTYEASAVIDVLGTTEEDYTLAFEQSKYELTEGESITTCLTIGDGFKEFQPQLSYDDAVISIAEPTDDSDCATVTALKAGQTTVVLTAEANGQTYSATTEVIVNPKQSEEDYSIAFDKELYELTEGESISVCLILGDSYTEFQPRLSYDDAVISIAEPNDDSDCATVTGLSAGKTSVVITAEVDGTKYTAETQVVVYSNIVVPDAELPEVSSQIPQFCYGDVTDGISFEDFAYVTTDLGSLVWYTAAGKELSEAPVISSSTAGSVTYYVAQRIYYGTSDNLLYVESEKLPVSVSVIYIPEPTLTNPDQKLCDGEEIQSFEAVSNYSIQWLDENGEVLSEGSTLMPKDASTGTYTYMVQAYSPENKCFSKVAKATLTVGKTIVPTITVSSESETIAPEETVVFTAKTDEDLTDQFKIVWTLPNGDVQSDDELTMSFDSVGEYTITCSVVNVETGCTGKDAITVTVEEKSIPVSTIAVEPSTIELYEGEQSYLALTFTPSFATDRNYNIEVANTEVADVIGLTVFGLAEGETTATISSASNPDATATVTIKVNKYIAAREISLPTIITMAPGDVKTVSASVLPANASYNEVFFTAKEDNVIQLTAEGVITAAAEGTSVITAYTKGGLKASAVVVVTASVAAITDIQVPESIEMKVGDSVSVSYKVVPASSLIDQLSWTIADNEVVTYTDGVVKALSAGTTTLTASYATIEKTIQIIVNESDAPVVVTTPSVSSTQGTDPTIDLSDFVSDDNTAVTDLTVTTTSDNFTVTVTDGIMKVTPTDPTFVGIDTVDVVVTDGDNLSVILPVVVEITEVQNQAPEILMDTIVIKFNACNYIQLADLVSDDFTPYNKIKYAFESKVKTAILFRKQLRLFTNDPDIESDVLTVTVTDADGLSTTKDIMVYLTALPNKAPKIAEIPAQNENDDQKFGVIELAQYVTDDYTASSAIAWSASDDENISVTISDGKASVQVLNEFWNGATAITFYAKDEEGLVDSTSVYYVRSVTIKKEDESQEPTTEVVATWEGAPSFDFMTMKTIGTPGSQFVLMASCSGYECTWSWDIPGANGVDPTSLMQFITFDEPGTYDVTFTVQSPDGNFEKSLTKENFLTVVGITDRNPNICKGDAITLEASEGMTSYYWTSGDVKNTTTVRPSETTTYAVTMKKGMFTLIDSVTVNVSVPVALMEDSVMCAGTEFELGAIGTYESYAWNTGATDSSIVIPSVVAQYTVTAVDTMNCVSVDTFNLTKVNELPLINLGENQTPCDGTTVTLDAGEGFEYLWSNNSTEQTIDLTAGTDTVWARITDANLCVNADTVVIAFTYPYPEQLGVATFSETTDHIILAWEKTAGVNTVSYRVERETDVTDNWEQVGESVAFTESGIVVDEDVNYKQRAYKYRLVTTDGCGNEATSEVHRSMISTTTHNDDGTKTLQWCAYEPMSNVTQYLVLRGYDATQMDTVDYVPASNLYEIWNETDSKYVDDKDIKYRVVFRLKSEINENAVNSLDNQDFEGYYTKAESGPFSLAMSNIAEAENEGTGINEIAFPADVVVFPSIISDVINVAISSNEEAEYKIEVVGVNGQTCTRLSTGEISTAVVEIPASELRQGMYHVKVTTKDGQAVTLKVIK